MSPWEVLGWTGNACFFSRFLLQWLASERAGRSVAPRAFWWLSLSGSLALASYTTVRGEPVLLLGLVTNGAIYLRNLLLADGGLRRIGVAWIATLASLGALLLTAAAWFATERMTADRSVAWLVAVGIGQLAWTSRFLVQWAASESKGHSHFPCAFWVLSLVGNSLLLAYALHRHDAILIAGYLPGPIVQVRNLILDARGRARSRTLGPSSMRPSLPRT